MDTNNITEQQPKRTLTEKAAQIISDLFSPLMIPVIAFILLFGFTFLRIMPLAYQISVISIVACLTLLFPLLGITVYKKLLNKGPHILNHRKKRFIPYIMTIISYAVCLVTMYRLHLPHYMASVVIVVLICFILCALINLRWKISIHTAGSGILIGGVIAYSWVFMINPLGWLSVLILLAGVVASARIIVRQHSLMEIGFGFVVGFFCGLAGILFI